MQKTRNRDACFLLSSIAAPIVLVRHGSTRLKEGQPLGVSCEVWRGLQEDRVSCCFFGFTLEFFSSSGKTPLVQLEHAFDASVPWPIPIPQRDGLPVSMGLGARQMALMVCDYL